MENTGKEQRMESIADVVGIAVTVIRIIVTIISIRQTAQKDKHQKSNRTPDK
ncbi:MAG: hypothetical protein NC254_07175 [bacterium]|nr:hypothetical protein [bacterium]